MARKEEQRPGKRWPKFSCEIREFGTGTPLALGTGKTAHKAMAKAWAEYQSQSRGEIERKIARSYGR